MGATAELDRVNDTGITIWILFELVNGDAKADDTDGIGVDLKLNEIFI